MTLTLLCLLMPCSTWRLFTWLVQPAGSGVVRRTLGGAIVVKWPKKDPEMPESISDQSA